MSLITIRQLAARLNRSPREIRRLAKLGRIPGAKLVTERLYMVEDSAHLMGILKPRNERKPK